MGHDLFRDAPDRVREWLSAMENESITGGWYVFETISADGSLAIGVVEGTPDAGTVMVVYERLPRTVALQAARGLASWHRDNGRSVGIYP